MRGLTLTQKEQGRLQTLNLVMEGRLGVGEAAYIMGLSERHTWRILASYRKVGAAALAHGNRGYRPANATSEETRQRVITLASTRYAGINHTHLTELLAEREGLSLARSTVRRLLVKNGIPSPRHRRPPSHRCRRERMPQEGMLIQVDGSYHQWLGEQGPWFTLLLSVDDATGKVPYALFQETEDTEGYFRLMMGIIQRQGIPLGLYSDRHIVFRRPIRGDKTMEAIPANNGQPTQFGRAMKELGVTQVFAHSPEAKGRVERANGTFQDRLVAELRLANANTIEEANRVLEVFLPRFNERFGVPATRSEPAYRPVDPELDIASVLCLKERRRVAKDNTVKYYGRTLQLYPGADRTSYARAHVEVQKRLDARILVQYHGKILTPGEAPPLAETLRAFAEARPAEGSLTIQDEVPVSEEHEAAPTRCEDLGWEGDWYRDESRKCQHRDLVRAGMERARQAGKRIGRPRVTERPDFLKRFAAVVQNIGPTGLSRRRAAKELAIGYATLKRLLDAQSSSTEQDIGGILLPMVTGSLSDE